MAEEEDRRNSEAEVPAEEPQAEETPAEEPQAEDAATEEPQAEETPAEEPEPEETPAEEPEVEQTPAEEPQAEEAPTEEAQGEDSPGDDAAPEVEAEAEPAVEAEPESEPEKAAPKSEEGAGESGAVPGADLEPIAIEDDENLSAEERARREAEAEEERARREAELAAEAADDVPAVREPAKLEPDARYRATGKRKSAIARVILVPGTGKVEINGRELETYFPRELHQAMVKQPLAATGYESAVDVKVLTHGGGIGGQATAVRHGIARALTEVDIELRGDLKRRGYLTRDARVKERRKAGFKKARKRPQFSKR